MLEHIKLQNILFLDVETVPVAPSFSDLPKNFQELWAEKTKWRRKDVYSPEEFYAFKAGLMAEFAKVVCMSRQDGYRLWIAVPRLKSLKRSGGFPHQIPDFFGGQLLPEFLEKVGFFFCQSGGTLRSGG